MIMGGAYNKELMGGLKEDLELRGMGKKSYKEYKKNKMTAGRVGGESGYGEGTFMDLGFSDEKTLGAKGGNLPIENNEQAKPQLMVGISGGKKPRGRPRKMMTGGQIHPHPLAQATQRVVGGALKNVNTKPIRLGKVMKASLTEMQPPIVQTAPNLKKGVQKKIVEKSQMQGSDMIGGKKPKKMNPYMTFLNDYRKKHNLSLKQAMKEIKEKGLYKK
jgi:hypothetical protein